MNGILNILKPPGMTSFDVVSYLRGILKIKKIGHAGTLDPGAAGVLPVCIGSATKAIEYMMDKEKEYRAELTLGVETDTQDSSGRVLTTKNVNVSEDEIKACIHSFQGDTQQIPPMYSAVKIKGKKLYELARKGIDVERKPRNITIYSIDIVKTGDEGKILFDVVCSKGTYIRTLCADIGQKLGCGGHMSFLVRKRAGIFDINSALTLEEIEQCAQSNLLIEKFVNIDVVFKDFRYILLNKPEVGRLLNGAFIHLRDSSFPKGEIIRLYDEYGSFFGLGEILIREGQLVLKSKKVFC